MSNAATREVRLLYDWTPRHAQRRRLVYWIVVALVLHVAAYFTFRASYPAPTGIAPANARLIMLPPDSEAARRLAPIIATADPSLYATDRSIHRSAPPAIPTYHPSFENAAPPLQPLPATTARLLPSLPRDGGPVVVDDGRPATPPRPAPARDTAVNFAGDLSGREIIARPTAAFTARPGDPLTRSRYLIAVDAAGSVRHVFEIEGTASPDINTVSIPYLLGFQFAPGNAPTDPESLAWGTATIHWGLDVRRQRLD